MTPDTTPTTTQPNAWSSPLDPELLSKPSESTEEVKHQIVVAPAVDDKDEEIIGPVGQKNILTASHDVASTNDLNNNENSTSDDSTNNERKKIIVLDSGAIITSASFSKQFLNDDVEFVTTAAVIKEIKSSKARATLNSLPFILKIQNVWADSLKVVRQYAERTGDYAFLSTVDMEVLGLTYQLELRENGKKFLKELPEKLDFGGKTVFKADLTPYPGSLDKWDKKPEEKKNDGWNSGIEDSWGYFDDENDNDGWITQENISKHKEESVGKESDWIVATKTKKQTKTEEKSTPSKNEETTASDQNTSTSAESQFPSAFEESASNVGCITTDYAMQNVLVQMGLNLISVEGRRILTLRRYVLRCTACRCVVPDTNRVFCPHCGNHSTLKRVECVVDENGKATFYYNPHYKFNLKGVNYQIPKPKGGQKNVDPILREDQMLSVRRGVSRKKRQLQPASSAFSRTDDLFNREYSIEGVFDTKSKKQSHWDMRDQLITGRPKPPPKKHKKKRRN